MDATVTGSGGTEEEEGEEEGESDEEMPLLKERGTNTSADGVERQG